MKPDKEGQIAKFHTALPGENREQQYVILEIIIDNMSRAKIQALNTGLPFPPISTVKLDDLEVVSASTADLIGEFVKIRKTDSTFTEGKVIAVDKDQVILDLSRLSNGIDTNVTLRIIDKDGKEHSGSLYIN